MITQQQKNKELYCDKQRNTVSRRKKKNKVSHKKLFSLRFPQTFFCLKNKSSILSEKFSIVYYPQSSKTFPQFCEQLHILF